MNFTIRHKLSEKPAKVNSNLLSKMAELTFSPVFQEITRTFRDEPFSTMYFGRHCGKNLLILKHTLSIMLAFGDDIQWSNPNLIKSVTTRGELVKGIQIVGHEDVILMLDEFGNLWRLINAFDFSEEKFESLHSLTNECFYEWVPFKKFNFAKILAICAMKQGFACIGLNWKFEKKLAVLHSSDLFVEEFTFDGLNTTDSYNFSLVYLDIDTENSALKNKLDSTKEILLVTDRFRGRTSLCTRGGKNCLINESNIPLVSALHYSQEKCVTLCFKSGKSVFYFYNECERYHIVYLPRKLVVVEKCCCSDFCLLWGDGIDLHHTKFNIESGHSFLKATHLKLTSAIQNPLMFLQIQQWILTTTINNVCYLITAGSVPATQIKKNAREFLKHINETSHNIDELEQNIVMLSHYVFCKDILKSYNMKEKVEFSWEGNSLIIKSLLGICLKHEFWNLRLKMQVIDKDLVHMVSFKCDLTEGMCIRVDDPFKNEGKIKVTLIGNFGGTCLFLDLGEVGSPKSNCKENQLQKCLENILREKNPAYIKG